MGNIWTKVSGLWAGVPKSAKDGAERVVVTGLLAWDLARDH